MKSFSHYYGKYYTANHDIDRKILGHQATLPRNLRTDRLLTKEKSSHISSAAQQIAGPDGYRKIHKPPAAETVMQVPTLTETRCSIHLHIRFWAKLVTQFTVTN